MAQRTHVSDDQQMRPCDAKPGNCPKVHFEGTAEQQQQQYEAYLAAQHGAATEGVKKYETEVQRLENNRRLVEESQGKPYGVGETYKIPARVDAVAPYVTVTNLEATGDYMVITGKVAGTNSSGVWVAHKSDIQEGKAQGIASGQGAAGSASAAEVAQASQRRAEGHRMERDEAQKSLVRSRDQYLASSRYKKHYEELLEKADEPGSTITAEEKEGLRKKAAEARDIMDEANADVKKYETEVQRLENNRRLVEESQGKPYGVGETYKIPARVDAVAPYVTVTNLEATGDYMVITGKVAGTNSSGVWVAHKSDIQEGKAQGKAEAVQGASDRLQKPPRKPSPASSLKKARETFRSDKGASMKSSELAGAFVELSKTSRVDLPVKDVELSHKLEQQLVERIKDVPAKNDTEATKLDAQTLVDNVRRFRFSVDKMDPRTKKNYNAMVQELKRRAEAAD